MIMYLKDDEFTKDDRRALGCLLTPILLGAAMLVGYALLDGLWNWLFSL